MAREKMAGEKFQLELALKAKNEEILALKQKLNDQAVRVLQDDDVSACPCIHALRLIKNTYYNVILQLMAPHHCLCLCMVIVSQYLMYCTPIPMPVNI